MLTEAPEIKMGAPIGEGCEDCGGPVCTGFLGSGENKRTILVCAWCKRVRTKGKK